MNEKIEDFIRIRNYSIDTIYFIWLNSRKKITSLINEIYPSSPEKIKQLITTVETFDEIINGMVDEKEFGINESPSEQLLKSHEKDLFYAKLGMLKEWYVEVLSFLVSDNPFNNESEVKKLWNKYEEMNYDFRYENDPSYKQAKHDNSFYCWKRDHHYPINFLYTDIFKNFSRMRNQIVHNSGARAIMNGNSIKKDHILNNKIPGNSIVLSNTITLFIYGYVELLETLKDSLILKKNNTNFYTTSNS